MKILQTYDYYFAIAVEGCRVALEGDGVEGDGVEGEGVEGECGLCQRSGRALYRGL
jgi:hypothetical protein